MDRTFGGSYDHIVKIKLVGDSGVGKSCIVLRFCDDQFNQNMMPTIGVDYRTRIFDIQNGQKAKAIIWDTAGQERLQDDNLELLPRLARHHLRLRRDKPIDLRVGHAVDEGGQGVLPRT